MGIGATTLYDSDVNINCMSYTCYMKLKDLISLKSVPAMSAHSVINLTTVELGDHRKLLHTLDLTLL